MILGFTGTRQGMTPMQKRIVRSLLKGHKVTEIHHGDCVGSDKDMHDIAVSLGIAVVIHPPTNPKLRAYCGAASLLKHHSCTVRKAEPYLVRNKAIVKGTDATLATPSENTEPPSARGQGTWSTVRFARKQGRLLGVVMPNGKIIH